MADSIETYITWVQSKIDMVEAYSQKLNKSDINIQDLKEVLSKKVHVSLLLNAEYQRYRRTLTDAEREFKVWWSEKFTEVRKLNNPQTITASKWISKSEIEAQVISDYKQEYLEYREKIDNIDTNAAFFRRLMDDWNSISYDCGNLVRVLEMEAYFYSDVSGRSEPMRRRIKESTN